MNEIQIKNSRINQLFILILAVLGAIGSCWFQAQIGHEWLARGVMVGCIVLALAMLWQQFRYRPKITLTVHGIQFFYDTQRIDSQKNQNIVNQFIAWEDIQNSQLHGKILQLQIDDNPPDYERLTEIELANLPPREMVLYQLNAAVGGLNVSAAKIADWVAKMQQSQPKERPALILSFHYER